MGNRALVGILMGSDSVLPVMKGAKIWKFQYYFKVLLYQHRTRSGQLTTLDMLSLRA